MPASRFPRLFLTVIKAVRISRRFPGDYHAYKLQAILESGLEEGGVYVDSDAVVTPFAPRLFEVLQAAEGDTLPLLPLHPCDPDNWAPLMRHLAAAPGSSDAVTTPTTPYLHADVIVFPAAALGFLREALRLIESAVHPVGGPRPICTPGASKGSGRFYAPQSAASAAQTLAVASGARLRPPQS